MTQFGSGIKFIAVVFVAALLGACSTKPATDSTDTTVDTGTQQNTTPPPVATPEVEREPIDRGPAKGSFDDMVAVVGGDRVFFAFDSSELSSSARTTLQRAATWMNDNRSVRITVEGHADERGTREYNLALGERRATAVKNYMAALGVSASRVGTISYGKERPAVLGSNESAWSQNRRGQITVNGSPGT